MADDPSALLDQIRERQQLASDALLGFSRMEERHAALIKVAYEDTPLLLAAVEAVLRLADDWDAKAREIAAQISQQDTEGAVAGFKMIGVTRYQEGAKALREAIRTALAGERVDP